eukprot:7387653-Prymnesium_polylepis.1
MFAGVAESQLAAPLPRCGRQRASGNRAQALPRSHPANPPGQGSASKGSSGVRGCGNSVPHVTRLTW